MHRFTVTQIAFDRGERFAPQVAQFGHPVIDPRFSSPLVCERNFALSGGGPPMRIIEQVCAGRKPVGFVDAHSSEPMIQAAQAAMDAGCAVRYAPHTFDSGSACVFVSVAAPGRVGETLDLQALGADYGAYFDAYDPQIAQAVRTELGRLSGRTFASFLEFSQVEVHPAAIYPELPVDAKTRHHPAAEYARCGLLLGYPVCTTAAIIGKRLGLAGFWSR